MVDEVDTSDNEIDYSDIDFSAFGGPAATTPSTEKEYDYSDIDFSAFTDVAPEEDSTPGYFSKLTEGFGTTLAESLKRTGSGVKLAAIEAFPDPDEPITADVPSDPTDLSLPDTPGLIEQTLRVGGKAYEALTGEDITQVKEDAVQSTLADIQANEELMAQATPEDLTFVQENIRGGLDSLAKNVGPTTAGIVATFVTKNPQLGTAIASGPMATMAGIDARTEARLAGLEQEAANAYGMRQGGLELAFEVIPDFLQNKIFKDAITDGVASVKDFAKTFATEMVGEQATTAYQDINTYLTGLDEEMGTGTVTDEIERRLQRQAATVIQTAVAASAQQTAVGGITKLAETPRASDQELSEQIENAPDIDTAIKIAEDVADMGEIADVEAPAAVETDVTLEEDLTPTGSDDIVEGQEDRRIVDYDPNAVMSQTSTGDFLQPHDLRVQEARDTSQRFIEYIPEDQRADFVKSFEPKHVVDPVTGFYKTEERGATMDRVKDYIKENPEFGDRAVYTEVDIANLGGLNNELGNSGANRIYRGITDIVANELDQLGTGKPQYDQVNIRHGGDEFSFITIGAEQAEVEQAITRAEQKVAEYIEQEGLSNLTHAKTKQPNYGVGIIGGTGIIDANVDNDANYKKADVTVELKKEEVKKAKEVQQDEQREEAGTDRDVQPEQRVTEREPGDESGTSAVREATSKPSEETKVAKAAAKSTDDIKPAKGAYDNREAAFRALRQKKKNKNLSEEQRAELDNFKPFKTDDGYVLRHTSKLPKLSRAQKKPKGATPKEGKVTPSVKAATETFGLPDGALREVHVEPKNATEKKVRQLIEDALGKKVVFFESGVSTFDVGGFVIPNKPGTIYVNSKADVPHMKVMGHELLHTLRRDNPEIYNDLVKALKPMLKDYKPYKKWVNAAQRKVKQPDLNNAQIEEELVADLLGDSIADPQFWNKLEDKSPKLYERVLDAVQEYLGKFIKSLNTKELRGTGYFKDYLKARSEVAKAVKRYKESGQPPVKESKSEEKSIEKHPQEDPVSEETSRDKDTRKLRGGRSSIESEVFGVPLEWNEMSVPLSAREIELFDTVFSSKPDRDELREIAPNISMRVKWGEGDVVTKGELIGPVDEIAQLPDFYPDELSLRFEQKLQRRLDKYSKEGPKLSPKQEQETGVPVKEAESKAGKFVEDFQKNLVDAYTPIRKTQKAIEGTGKKLSDEFNIDQAITLFPGQTRAEIDDFVDQVQTPFIDAYQNSGLTWQEASEYLHARHAKEANAVLKERNPNREDNDALSGMSNEKATEILKKYKGRPEVQRVGQLNDKMNQDRIDYLVDNGLLSETEANAWRENYKHYVPLHREDVDSIGLPSRGQGFDVRGKASKLRAGSTRAVDYNNMLAHILSQQQAFIVKANKNKVSKTLWNLAKSNPDPDLWLTNKEQFPQDVKVLLKSGEIASSVNLQDKNIFSHKVNGEDRYLYFNKDNPVGRDMAAAMKNLNKSTDAKWIEIAGKVNRYLSQIVTSWSPEFMITNFERDIQTAAYNLTDTELKDYTSDVIKGVPSAMAGIRNALRGKNDSDMAKVFDDFRKTGGMTGWMQSYDNIEQQTKEIQREVEGWSVAGTKVPGKKSVDKVFDFVNDYNTVVENAVRLSAYNEAVKRGMTKRQAAKISKELTVDFNRKGEWGTAANAAYLFFNAGIQGSARLLRASLNPKNKRLHKMMLATVALSAMTDMINRLTFDEEDDYNQLIEREGARNFVINDPFGFSEKGYIKFPLPWGYNVLHIMGQELSAAMAHQMGINPDYKAIEGAGRLTMGTLEAFNPLQEGSMAQTISPTLLDPFMRITENKDWHGGPLYPNFNKEAPNYTKFYGTAREESKEIARWLYEATLNPDTMKSAIDWSPEWIDMGFDFVTGGLGRFVADSKNLAQNIIDGKDFELKEVPFARKVYGQIGPSSQKSSFYGKMYDIVNMDIELNRIKKEQGLDDFKKYRKEIGPKRLSLVAPAKAARKDIKRFKKRIRKLEAAGKNEQAKKVEKLMLNRMAKFNTLYQKRLYGDKNLND